MDYNDEFEENEFPKRTDDRYKKIEKFKPYELTHCIVFEMAVRNKDVRASIELIASIEKVLNIKYSLKSDNDSIEVTSEEYEKLEKKRQEYLETYEEGIHILKNKYCIHYDQNKVNIPEIENPFKEKYFSDMSFEEIEEEFSDALRSPMMKHVSGAIGKFLRGEEYPLYKSDHNIYEGFVTARGIDPRCKTFDISSINTHFQRKIYDTNQINVALNMLLPEDELVEYIKHIKKILSDKNSKELKTPNKLLGKDVQEAKKTKHYPKKQTATKLADMFFVYDYVNKRLKQIDNDRSSIDQKYKDDKAEIKNDPFYNSDDKLVQLKVLQQEYSENKVDIGLEGIFKEIVDSVEDISFTSASTASNYYYALKPYIEDCRYSEFLTGESIIEDKEDIEGQK